MGSALTKNQTKQSCLSELFVSFQNDRSGAMAVEYGLIVTLLSLVVVGGIGLAYDAIEFLFADNNSDIQQALN